MKKRKDEVENSMNQSVNDDLKYQELLILAYLKAHYKKYEFNDIAQIMGMTYVEMRDCIEHLLEIIYVFLTIFLYLLKCPQSLILSALRAFCFCGKPHISRSIFLYFRYQAWLKSW